MRSAWNLHNNNKHYFPIFVVFTREVCIWQLCICTLYSEKTSNYKSTAQWVSLLQHISFLKIEIWIGPPKLQSFTCFFKDINSYPTKFFVAPRRSITHFLLLTLSTLLMLKRLTSQSCIKSLQKQFLIHQAPAIFTHGVSPSVRTSAQKK